MTQDFFSFDEALGELNLKEEELKRLVSEGEIRAFREGDTMKLRRGDVESLKSELMGGEVVDVGDVGDELVFEDDLELEETGMATEEISDMDTLLEEDVEDVGEVELEAEEPLVISDEAEEELAPAARRAPKAAAIVEDAPEEPLYLRAVAMLTAMVLLGALPVMLSVSGDDPGAIAQWISDFF